MKFELERGTQITISNRYDSLVLEIDREAYNKRAIFEGIAEGLKAEDIYQHLNEEQVYELIERNEYVLHQYLQDHGYIYNKG